MSITDFFRRNKPSPDARQHVVESQRPAFDKVVAAGRLRHGMWVRVDGKTGILCALSADGSANVMLVKPDGTNLLEIATQVGAIKQASYEDIPAPRRKDLSPDKAAAMGYRSQAGGLKWR